MNKNRKPQRGYALAEVLIAVAIAAATLAAASGAFAGIVRLNQKTAEHAKTLNAMRLLDARLEAGMDSQAAIQGLEGWRLVYSPFGYARPGDRPRSFTQVSGFHGDNEVPAFEKLIFQK